LSRPSSHSLAAALVVVGVARAAGIHSDAVDLAVAIVVDAVAALWDERVGRNGVGGGVGRGERRVRGIDGLGAGAPAQAVRAALETLGAAAALAAVQDAVELGGLKAARERADERQPR
jgi:hypothetical protein